MKKLFFLAVILFTIGANGQNINVTFSGTGLTSVTAENMTKLVSVTVDASDTLILSSSVGIDDAVENSNSAISIYPNPSGGQSVVRIIPPKAGEAIITAYDVTGKPLANRRVYLESTAQSYNVAGLGNGFYLISVKGVDYNLSGKLLSTGGENEKVTIEPADLVEVADKTSSKKISKGSTAKYLLYSSGDYVKFTGTSGNNRTVIVDRPSSDKTINFTFHDCTDADGNHYSVVQIGSQLWTAENLRTTKYADGSTISGYSWPNSDIGNKNPYGALYVWDAVADPRNICPEGWHASTYDEWNTMISYIGGRTGGFTKIKETGPTHWGTPNSATNSTGFTALPAGLPNNAYGYFGPLGRAYLWTSTESSSGSAYMNRGDDTYLSFGNVEKTWGFSVRCLEGSILPVISTSAIAAITDTTATVGGEVKSDGGDVVTERGVYWGASSNPVSTGTKVQIGSGIGVFSTDISELTPNTKYYVRAYAINSLGTAYGSEISFVTTGPKPILTTDEITSITATTATGGGEITDDEGDAVIARGICWSASHNPTLSNSKTVDGSGLGTFTSSITGLNSATTYYVRAYATNSALTVYGNEVSFTTVSTHVSDTFYVSTTGNDSNPGTTDQPWRTVQKAASTIAPGDVAIVRPGVYNEYVTISRDGTSDIARIKIVSDSLHKAKVYGFSVGGNYVTVDGFEVESTSSSGTGISVSGSSYSEILNCSVNEFPNGGINVTSSYVSVIGNTCDHNGQWGIRITGSHNLVENNIISHTVQLHLKITSVPAFNGQDADGMRVFGQYHTVRGNQVIDICDPEDPANDRFPAGEGPHSDGIQTWDNPSGEPVMSNTIIEGNYFRMIHPSGKGIIISALKDDDCNDLIIRNNIFEFRDIGISAYEGAYSNIFIYNNVFKAYIENVWGCGIALSNIDNYAVINNITIDCNPEHRKISGGSGVVDYNLIWAADGSTPSLTPPLQPHEILGNPKLVTYGYLFGTNDYHLQSDSPAIDAGLTIEDVTEDLDKVSRPQGSGYDIGPFEYVGSK